MAITQGKMPFVFGSATPLPSQAIASPSMMQERERRRASVSTRKMRGLVIAAL
jgi:hypothetical protein